MECPEWKERISAYVDGEAPDGEVLRVEEHLVACAACRALERKMRAVGIGVSRTETEVPPRFREDLFARMESEDLLPKRRSLFVFSLRWAAIPLAAVAALALFLLTPGELRRDLEAPAGKPRIAQRAPTTGIASPPHPGVPQRVQPSTPEGAPGNDAPRKPVGQAGRDPVQAVASARGAGEMTPEEREIVAHLEVLEDPSALEDPGLMDEMENFIPTGSKKG